MILYTVAITAVLGSPDVDVTEPAAVLHGQTADPFVLDLGKRLDAAVHVEVLAVSIDLRVVVAFGDLRHTELELADATRYTDAGEIAVVPVKHHARTRAARVEAVVAGKQVILSLGAYGTGTLACQAPAMGILHFHAELHHGQPGMQLLGVKVNRTTLQHRRRQGGRVVFAVTRSKTVEIKSRLDFPQAVVHAVKETRPKAPALSSRLGCVRHESDRSRKGSGNEFLW